MSVAFKVCVGRNEEAEVVMVLAEHKMRRQWMYVCMDEWMDGWRCHSINSLLVQAAVLHEFLYFKQVTAGATKD